MGFYRQVSLIMLSKENFKTQFDQALVFETKAIPKNISTTRDG